jgi:hypothetical protein
MSQSRKQTGDEGIALVAGMVVMVLMAGIAAGLTALVITDTRVRALDGTRTQSFYMAHAGLEKLTADLGDLFSVNFAPTAAQLNAIASAPPALGVGWYSATGGDGYAVTFPTGAGGNPQAAVTTVMGGPFQGLVGLATPYRMDVTARMPDQSEASLTRTLQTVAIPVFQFGIFSENDLSFFAGPNFNFGGRVHSNDSIYLAEGGSNALTLADRVTAVGEIIRTHLANGWPTSSGYTGFVRVITAPAAYRDLLVNEGSLVGTVGSALNEPLWSNLSTGTYNSNITNSRTGARRLSLPITSFGAQPIDIIRRPVANEHITAPLVLAERMFSLASLRILLSDTAAEISSLPTVTATAPVQLGGTAPAGYVGAPFGRTPAPGSTGSRSPSGTPVMGGFLKIERQNADGSWTDVTLEILNLGIAGRQWPDPATGSPNCTEPYPNAVLRIERLRDTTSCLNGSTTNTNYIPQVLYDAREANHRDNIADTAPMTFGGIMHYVELDARNLSRWFQGAIGTTGTQALNANGYTVYFSDRRGNKNTLNQETGEFGHEDMVNPLSATGAPNGILDTGEDFNGSGALDGYGTTPRLITGMTSPLVSSARPWTNLDPTSAIAQSLEILIAQRNPAIFFRRALKLTNGALGNLVAPGLTIVAENPVYIQGNWNANGSGFGNPHVATSVIADSVTLLSNAWNDRRSMLNPHQADPRNATTTWYRLAIIAGKGLPFPWITGTYQDYGTDGGAHNFLRYIEDWGGQTLNYRGSIVSFYRSRQANGIYKCCADVYSPPTRGYNFDTDFLTPSLLPPRTPMFRDVNITGFAQVIRPQ